MLFHEPGNQKNLRFPCYFKLCFVFFAQLARSKILSHQTITNVDISNLGAIDFHGRHSDFVFGALNHNGSKQVARRSYIVLSSPQKHKKVPRLTSKRLWNLRGLVDPKYWCVLVVGCRGDLGTPAGRSLGCQASYFTQGVARQPFFFRKKKKRSADPWRKMKCFPHVDNMNTEFAEHPIILLKFEKTTFQKNKFPTWRLPGRKKSTNVTQGCPEQHPVPCLGNFGLLCTVGLLRTPQWLSKRPPGGTPRLLQDPPGVPETLPGLSWRFPKLSWDSPETLPGISAGDSLIARGRPSPRNSRHGFFPPRGFSRKSKIMVQI